MKNILFIGFILFCSGCFTNQHEERIATGDTISAYEIQPNCNMPHSPEKLIKENTLFEEKCRSCHISVGTDASCQIMPGIIDRIPSGDWKYHWFHNPDSMITAGDAYANKLKADWNNQPHPAFPELSREEIDELLQYISEW
jgi:hypothetical protein